MIAIVVSRADYASEHIGEQLRALAGWTEHTDPSRADGEGGGRVYRLDAAGSGGNGGDERSDRDGRDDENERDDENHGGDGGDDSPTTDDLAFELRSFDAMHLDLERPADAFGTVEDAPETDPDLLLFVSRHSGDTGPLLTCHFTGNFGAATYGGTDGGLARTCPNAQKRLLAAFDEHAPDGYEVGMECTHHGPSEVGVPSMFVELGSDEDEWEDPDGARAVARSVLDLAGVEPDVPAGGGASDGGAGSDVADGDARTDAGSARHLAGFGGGHYVPRFERVVRETAWGVGHVASDWQLAELGDPAANPETLRRAFERSRADYALVEGANEELRSALADLDGRVVSETWVREVDDRPLGLVAALESDLAPVDDGLRFGEVVPTTTDGGPSEPSDAYAVRRFPAELLSEAQGIDPETTRAAVESSAVAFLTEQSGTRAVGRVALPTDGGGAGPGGRTGTDGADAAYRSLVDALADVLARKYDAVTTERDAVVARETAFVPAKARELGVSEGPAFGRLADGESVEVDGETVRPADVRDERERRFDV